jgi:hypothetical protein
MLINFLGKRHIKEVTSPSEITTLKLRIKLQHAISVRGQRTYVTLIDISAL